MRPLLGENNQRAIAQWLNSKPWYVLRPSQLRTKVTPLRLPHWIDGYRYKILAALACYCIRRVCKFSWHLPRTKNHHSAIAPFPWFSAIDSKFFNFSSVLTVQLYSL